MLVLRLTGFDPRENSNDGALFETEPVPDGGGGLPGIA